MTNWRLPATVEAHAFVTVGVDGVEKLEESVLPELLAVAAVRGWLAKVHGNPKEVVQIRVDFMINGRDYVFEVGMTHDGGLVAIQDVSDDDLD